VPSKDPKTGKRLSGAAQDKRAKQKLEAERIAEATGGSPHDLQNLIKAAFARVGPPPMQSTGSLITWGAKMQATVIWLAAQNPALFDSLASLLRFEADAIAKLGMIRDKAKEQEDIKKALGRDKKRRDDERPEYDGPAPTSIPPPPRRG